MKSGRWHRFWFEGGGRLSVACVRIGIALAVLGSLQRLLLYVGDPKAYDPDGILQFLGADMPSQAFLKTLLVVAYVSTVAMLVGFYSRASTAISLVSALVLVSYDVSFMPGWIRSNNVVYLAHIAFLGARSGDALSIDAWLRKRRGLPAATGNYKWSLQLVQLAIALMFLSAAAAKWANGGFTLSWVFSDSMRHHLLMQFDVLGKERTALANLVIDSAFLYKGLALGSMFSQSLPTAAVFLMNRPRLRFACGSLFFAEAIGFGLLLGLWDLHWVPLFAAFIDWDRFVAWIRRRRGKQEAELPSSRSPQRPRLVNGFITVYLIVYVGTAFNPLPWDLELHTYPFSRFPMFSVTRAKRPYDVHQSYDIIRGRFELGTDEPTPAVDRWLRHEYAYRWMHRDDQPAKLETKLGVVQRKSAKRCKCEVSGLRLHHTVLRSPAYPEPAGLTEHRVAVVGELTADGAFRTAVGDIEKGEGGKTVLVTRSAGIPLEQAKVVHWRGDALEPVDVPFHRDGNRFIVDVEMGEEPETFALEIDGIRFLVERTGNTY